MAATGPAGALRHIAGMVVIPNIHLSRHISLTGDILLLLKVALEAEHLIARHQELLVDGTVRIVAGGATLTQRLMLEDKWSFLRRVALKTDFIFAHQIRGTSTLHNGSLVGIMAVAAAHPPLHHAVAVGKIELGADFQMALETGLGILARIDDQLCIPPGTHMQATGSMASFASGVLGIFAAGLEFGMIRCLKITGDLVMAIGAGLGTHKGRTRNAWGSHNRILQSSAGDQAQHQGGSTAGNP